MKESITKFDLEAAFKALDEIDIPTVKKGIKANKAPLTEIFSRKSKFDALMEEYYDIGNSTELSDAKEAREAEVAKAKLARIEKIVDLDAESPDDLLTSYVGKFIIQCPQCMTLFYKSPEDVEESEDDPTTVNVAEKCQHCGNDSGYTLIGRVGEATQEEQDELKGVQEVDVDSTTDVEETTEDTAEESSDEELDLDIGNLDDSEELDLDTISLDDEDAAEEEAEDSDDKKEESVFTSHTGDQLVEELHESTELDVSADEFEALINSPEFKKPISDHEVRAMMNMEESTTCRADAEQECAEDSLEEGIFDKVGKAVDKLAGTIKTKDAKADWLLKNIKKGDDPTKSSSKAGELAPKDNEAEQRFKVFIAYGFRNVYANNKPITIAPHYNSSDLVPAETANGKKEGGVAEKYADIAKWAKGWSKKLGNGPVLVYLADSKAGNDKLFLSEYFQGELVDKYDQIDNYFEKVKEDVRGTKQINDSKVSALDDDEATEETAATEPTAKTKEIKASDLTVGKQMVHNDKAYHVAGIAQSAKNSKELKITLSGDGKTQTVSVSSDAKIAVTESVLSKSSKKESLKTVLEHLDNIQESSLENLISDTLVKSYRNVAGFKVNNCSYLNENFKMSGTVYFTSGRKREITYTFTEAYKTKGNRIIFKGLNEKLGRDKQFSLVGRVDDTQKTLITESFRCVKK